MNGYKFLNLDFLGDIEELMKVWDTDGSGFIDYSEFITAALSRQ
jgi:Ca2+-binding EF-hand superfamily protein